MASPISCSFCSLEQKRRGKKKDIRNEVGLEGDAGIIIIIKIIIIILLIRNLGNNNNNNINNKLY